LIESTSLTAWRIIAAKDAEANDVGVVEAGSDATHHPNEAVGPEPALRYYVVAKARDIRSRVQQRPIMVK
jgi:hypothetical protein